MVFYSCLRFSKVLHGFLWFLKVEHDAEQNPSAMSGCGPCVSARFVIWSSLGMFKCRSSWTRSSNEFL